MVQLEQQDRAGCGSGVRRLVGKTNSGRGHWSNVEELTGACIFLSSDAASLVNGHTLFVDGGVTASL